MRRFFLAAGVRADLLAAFWWLDERNPRAAARWYEAVRGRFCQITEMPGIGAPRNEVFQGARSSVVKPYVIYYRVDETRVEVLRILHGSRDHDAIFRGED